MPSLQIPYAFVDGDFPVSLTWQKKREAILLSSM